MRFTAGFVILSWTATLAIAGVTDLGDPRYEQLEAMVRSGQRSALDREKLPFDSLRERRDPDNPDAFRRKVCAECMADWLALHFMIFLGPTERPIQISPQWAGRPFYKEWYWSYPNHNPKKRINSMTLAESCTKALDARFPSDDKCDYTDFDEGLSHIYDPQRKILVVRQREEEKPRQGTQANDPAGDGQRFQATIQRPAEKSSRVFGNTGNAFSRALNRAINNQPGSSPPIGAGSRPAFRMPRLGLLAS